MTDHSNYTTIAIYKEDMMMVMNRVCRDEVVARAVEKMWKKSISSVSTPTGLDLCCLVIKRHDEYVFFL